MKQISSIFLIGLSFFVSTFCLAADLMSPVGYWKTVDDVTGKPKSILQISLTANQTLFGRVVKLLPGASTTICTACTGAKHNQPILGMIVMENLRQNPNLPAEWSGGTILDPKNGKTYRVSLGVIEGGQKLNVRGYLGITLFGRTQTWFRVTKP